eukprot:scaffold315027_cov23-Tisochrysis_lutea.AAC.2
MAVPWKLKECVNILLPPGVNLAVSLRMLPPFRCALMYFNVHCLSGLLKAQQSSPCTVVSTAGHTIRLHCRSTSNPSCTA